MTEESQDRPFEHEIVVLLVDDQAIIGEAVRRILASQSDIRFHYCQDPTQALAMAVDLGPTVILQDLVMPEINGLELVSLYRQHESMKDTPLIMLSTKEEGDTKAEAFARGANDYIVKLPEPVELLARIRYHSRGYIALLERREAFAALAASERALKDELAKAANYVRSLLPERLRGPVQTDWRFIPSAALGGDAFDYQWLDDEHLAICLLDVCGHGVGSALLSISAINTLRSQTLPNTDFRQPSQVLEGLNRAFPMERQNSMFFTMWYGVYNAKTRRLTHAGGGHPPALLVPRDTQNRSIVQLDSAGPIIGIDDVADFASEVVEVAPEDQLLVYSDGVFEVKKAQDGEMWTLAEFIQWFGSVPAGDVSRMDALIEYTRQLQGGDEYLDDFSIVEFTF